MKYSPQNYAKAFVQKLEEVSLGEVDDLIKNFIKKIVHYGDFSGIGKIQKAVEYELIKRQKGKLVEVEFAREIDEKVTRGLLVNFTEQDLIRIKINNQLVAGTRITIDGEREFDNSLRGKLNKIFN